MNRATLAALAWAMLAAAPLCSKTPEEPSAFDVASVKPCEAGVQVGAMMQEKPGSLHYRHVNLEAVIRRAYNADAPQIAGPSWSAPAVTISRPVFRRTPPCRALANDIG